MKSNQINQHHNSNQLLIGANGLIQNQVMYGVGNNNSAATINSNKSTSAGGTVVGGLWKNSSKLMRDPDQIGSQMMNGAKLGANNSSTIFGNSSAGYGGVMGANGSQ